MTANAGAAPGGYLAGFARALERIEITGTDGGALPVDEGLGGIVDAIVAVKARGAKVLLVGNGGSAAIASHVHNDLCKSVGVRAMVFNETPLLTAHANDDGYADVFCRPLALWADPGDLLIAVSSSGESPNILRAAERAREKGCRVATFTGFEPGNRLRRMGDLNVYVPASTYGYVEMAHSVVAHCVTDLASVRTAASV